METSGDLMETTATAEPGNTDTGSANNENKQRGNQYFYWCFTFNNYNDGDVET